jgi:hypothetical protein
MYDEVEYSSQRDAWKGYFVEATPAVAIWTTVRPSFPPAFRQEIDNILPKVLETREAKP